MKYTPNTPDDVTPDWKSGLDALLAMDAGDDTVPPTTSTDDVLDWKTSLNVLLGQTTTIVDDDQPIDVVPDWKSTLDDLLGTSELTDAVDQDEKTYIDTSLYFRVGDYPNVHTSLTLVGIVRHCRRNNIDVNDIRRVWLTHQTAKDLDLIP